MQQSLGRANPSRLTKALAILLALTIVALIAVSLLWAAHKVNRDILDNIKLLEAKRPYAPAGKFLPEDEALTIANAAMEAAGYPTDQWVVRPSRGSQAPDGRTDEYFERNRDNPHGGHFTFYNEDDSAHPWYRQLTVTFERDGDRLRVTVWRHK